MEDYTRFLCIATEAELQFVKNILNIDPNDISLLFFHSDNISYLNNKIISEILKLTTEKMDKPIRIQEQKEEYMITHMRYIYFDNVRNNMSTKEEVEHLNKRFLESIIPHVYSELVSYLKYLDEIELYQDNKKPLMNNPVSTKRRNELKPLSKFFDI